eukprot:TRINITY_DN12254_c0_g1_i1.p1 TRINITY_DN12254_c0_g1~~TRINITY_DN12254_c0_g1_i1.p1  ORF type:complete len:223 (-),score=21.53 TRINITY_DN12254_c0_g1_i1:168-836(-)
MFSSNQIFEQRINDLIIDLQTLQHHQACPELYLLLEQKLYGFHQSLKLVLSSFEIGSQLSISQKNKSYNNDDVFVGNETAHKNISNCTRKKQQDCEQEKTPVGFVQQTGMDIGLNLEQEPRNKKSMATITKNYDINLQKKSQEARDSNLDFFIANFDNVGVPVSRQKQRVSTDRENSSISPTNPFLALLQLKNKESWQIKQDLEAFLFNELQDMVSGNKWGT